MTRRLEHVVWLLAIVGWFLLLASSCGGGSSSTGSRGDDSRAPGPVRGGMAVPDAGVDAGAPATAVDAPSALDVATDVPPYACRRGPSGEGCCLCKDPGGRGDTCCLNLDCGGKLCQGECYGVSCVGVCTPEAGRYPRTGCTPSGEICGAWTSAGGQYAPYCSTCPSGDTATARTGGLSCPAGGGPCALDQGRVCMCGVVGAGSLTRSLPCCDQRCQT